MKSFRLHIHSLDFENKDIWGIIYVEFNGCFFPDEQWYDAVLSVVDMWLGTLVEFFHNKDARCDLHFMDGPYKMCLNLVSTNRLEISLFERNERIKVSVISILDFLDAITSCIDSFLESCQAEGHGRLVNKLLSRILVNRKRLQIVLDHSKQVQSTD